MNHVRNRIAAGSSFLVIAVVAASACNNQESRGLALSVADSEHVAGTFEAQGMNLAFDARRDGECNVVDVKDGSGRFVLGARSCPGGDALELADHRVIPFPAGALSPSANEARSPVSAADPRDESRLAEFASGGTYEGLRALTAAMEEHPLFAGVAGTTRSSMEIGNVLSTQSKDPDGCAACHLTCGLADASCVVAAGWSPAVLICGIVAAVCHGGCAIDYCQ